MFSLSAGCWCLGHAFPVIYKLTIGILTLRSVQKTETTALQSLQEFATQMATTLGLEKKFEVLFHNRATLIQVPHRLLIPSSHEYSDDELKFLTAYAMCRTQSRDPLLIHLVSLVVSAVFTYLSLRKFPVFGYFIGLLSGWLCYRALSEWTSKQTLQSLDRLCTYSPEVARGALSFFRKNGMTYELNFFRERMGLDSSGAERN